MGLDFETSIPQKIIFGAGRFSLLDKVMRRLGRNALLVTGAGFPDRMRQWDDLLDALEKEKMNVFHIEVAGEPSPEFVDGAVEKFRGTMINVVAGIGGGSALDAGKAISAMLPQKNPVIDFLEGVGTKRHNGIKVPYIAVPTTSGTGSEATKNAVLSRVGADGFKKSLRHDNLVPDVVIVDPELAATCPGDISAACGMDAFTQLLEAYVSTKSNPLTDALALSGIEKIAARLEWVCGAGCDDIDARADMAYASLMSGVALANAGLGLVHGIAGPIGGFFRIPHGVACGTLMAKANKMTIGKLKSMEGGEGALAKFSKAGAAISGRPDAGLEEGCDLLTAKLEELTESLKIPRLGRYGIKETDLDKIVAASDNKNNPAALDEQEMRELLGARL